VAENQGVKIEMAKERRGGKAFTGTCELAGKVHTLLSKF
jgi:hypothetical protein